MDGIKRCDGGTTIKTGITNNEEDRIVWKGEHIYQDAPSINASKSGDLFVKEVERSRLPSLSAVDSTQDMCLERCYNVSEQIGFRR